jgi:hypothetical protein
MVGEPVVAVTVALPIPPADTGEKRGDIYLGAFSLVLIMHT